MRPPTLSLIRRLLWVDVLTKATRRVKHVTFCYRAHVDIEVLGFWEFLDRVLGKRSFADTGAGELVELYGRYERQPGRPKQDMLRCYTEAVGTGWLHPATRRILELFAGYAELLNVPDPLMVRNSLQDPAIGFGDGRPARDGRTARVAADLAAARGGALPNHLARALLDTAPAIYRNEPAVVVHDDRLTSDFVIMERVVAEHTPAAYRLAVRDLDEETDSPSLDDFEEIVAEARRTHGEAVTQIGLRLYFLAALGRTELHGFQPVVLRRWFTRADRLLNEAQDTGAELTETLAGIARGGYVCPYTLTAELLGRRPMPRKEILSSVYV
jgi:hypothetical protein